MKEKRAEAKKNQKLQSKHLAGATIREIWGRGKWKNLFVPVDISSLVFFRVLFGLLMLYEVIRYFNHNWIERYWIEPKYHFTYWPFDFLSPLPGDGMFMLFYLMGFLSICIAIGLFYRVSMGLFFLCFSYTFLLEQTRYMNHFYLVILIAFVMIFVPAHTSVSVDSRIFKRIRSETAPSWSLWLLRFMIGIPYFFGGIAKLNADWLQGEPLKMWLAERTDFPVIGTLFSYDWMIFFMAYTGMFLDLFIVPALLFKKTRKWAFLFGSMFHLMNSQLFQIGIFPWFMVAATSLFFNPDWFRKFINSLRGNKWQLTFSSSDIQEVQDTLSLKQKIILAALVVWAGIQMLVPLRHIFIPGNVHWTEGGHRYAWHMKLRSKRGKGDYIIQDKKTGQRQKIKVKNYLTKNQRSTLNDAPYLIWQFCRIVKEDYALKGIDVAVYANIKASLNGRKYQQFIDSTVDLSTVPRPIQPGTWIVPLTIPLNDREEPDKN